MSLQGYESSIFFSLFLMRRRISSLSLSIIPGDELAFSRDRAHKQAILAPMATPSEGTGNVSTAMAGTSRAGGMNEKYLWSADLSDFLNAVPHYDSTVPEEVVKYYMQKAGINVDDERVVSIAALACDKFLSDTLFEAKQIGKLRGQRKSLKRKVSKQRELTLIHERTIRYHFSFCVFSSFLCFHAGQ